MTPTGGAAWQQSALEPRSCCDLPSVILLARGEQPGRDPTAFSLRVVGLFFQLRLKRGDLGCFDFWCLWFGCQT